MSILDVIKLPKKSDDIWKLFNAADGALGALIEAVREFVSERRGEFDDKSQKWQDSDRGQDWSGDCDTLDSFADDLEQTQGTIQDYLGG